MEFEWLHGLQHLDFTGVCLSVLAFDGNILGQNSLELIPFNVLFLTLSFSRSGRPVLSIHEDRVKSE